jgi:hypothetical protein
MAAPLKTFASTSDLAGLAAVNMLDQQRKAAGYVDRILKGRSG